MTDSIGAWIRRQPVAAFYVLAFTITWAGWLPQAAHSRDLFPFDSPLFYVLGGLGPGLAALIVRRVLHGEAAVKELFEPFLRWHVGLVWYGVVVLGYPAAWVLTSVVNGDLGAELDELSSLLGLLLSVLIYLVAAVPEEAGGGASPCPGCKPGTAP